MIETYSCGLKPGLEFFIRWKGNLCYAELRPSNAVRSKRMEVKLTEIASIKTASKEHYIGKLT